MAASMGRLILQSDWDQVLGKSNESTWITFKTEIPPSTHGKLTSQGASSDGIPYVTGSDGFAVQEVTKKSISVTYKSDSVELTRLFLAPRITFSTVHTPGKTISCVDTTPGGLGVSADSLGRLRIWQTSNGEIRRELEGHLGDVYTCRFFPSGLVVLSGGSDMQLKIWSAETGKCGATLIGHRAGVQDTAIVDRGRNIVSCGRDGTARLWDVGQQACLDVFSDCGGEVNCCSIGVPSDVCGDLGQPAAPPSDREVLTEGKLLLLGCENKTLQGYGLQSRKKVFELPTHDAVNCCCHLSDVSAVYGTQDGHVTVVDYRNVKVPLKEWKDTRGPILSLCPLSQGFFFSAGDGSCCYVNSQGETTVELTGADCDPLYRVSSDGSHIYTCCRDGLIRKYSLSHVGLSS
ncbi:proteasomal ATPase-associated factor 1-like [Ylistrum balloti]|uniref:proteasomal ATPase-associated factor 1-like n=1 Tax=Ylistrum balloti TaxID=509963 RepID=UPI002905AA5B|nr:proteasomal ATPase-associated factor 1-like [Ylistrum balloti]